MTAGKKPLTDIAVKTAAPRAAQYELPDPKTAGLYLVVFPTSKKSWVYRYRFAGQPKKLTLGKYPSLPLAGARKAVEKHAGTKALGSDPAAEKQARVTQEKARVAEKRRQAGRPTVSDLCNAYIAQWAEVRNKPKYAAESARHCEHYITPELGKRYVDEIRPSDIEALLTKVYNRELAIQKTRPGPSKAPIAANRLRSTLSKMFILAETRFDRPGGREDEKMRPLNSNPVKGAEHHTETKRRRHATAEELPRLAEALDYYAGEYPEKIACLWTLFFSGARVSEINQARRSEWLGDRLRKIEHKTDSTIGVKDVLLPPQAVDILKDLSAGEASSPDDPDPLLFGHGDLRPVWYKVRARAKLGDLRLMDARRTFASVAKSAGKTLDQVGEILHHTDVKTTRRYAWLFDDAARATVNETATQLAGLMGLRQPAAPSELND